ncbi:hypothetical protein NE237_006326 [Protea cynaroides]|uniref:Uncharacterized protein n=1 Tax=Protea cynaroides TaxID=273540 RepID=A0A9Q0QVB5_9MAGN|nr:hypothetical protein NE237_006326 [Protea cynaroides]
MTAPKSESSKAAATDPSITHSNLVLLILNVSVVFFAGFLYLIIFHYEIEEELKRSILINTALSFVGFFITLLLIPVGSRNLLQRNMFGYDINKKKGTPQGSVRVLEPSISDEAPEQDYRERSQRAEFVQQLVLSTIF